MTIRYLNIEVVLGVVALAQLASFTLGRPLTASWYIVVALVVWSVYTIDRIIDARNPSTTPLTGRHQFHARHRTILLTLASGALCVSAVTAVIFFPFRYWIAALPLGTLTLAHLAMQRTSTRWMSIIKDVNVAITYTLAAWVIPVADDFYYHTHRLDLTASAVLLSSMLLVAIDVIMLSRYERDHDSSGGWPSISVALGPQKTRLVLVTLRVTVAMIAAFVVMRQDALIALTLLAMTAAYTILERWKIKRIDDARLAIDAVLLLPLILLLFSS